MSYINRGPRLIIFVIGCTLVILSEKRGLTGISKFGPGENGSSSRVYLHVYARDFWMWDYTEEDIPYVAQDDLWILSIIVRMRGWENLKNSCDLPVVYFGLPQHSLSHRDVVLIPVQSEMSYIKHTSILSTRLLIKRNSSFHPSR